MARTRGGRRRRSLRLFLNESSRRNTQFSDDAPVMVDSTSESDQACGSVGRRGEGSLASSQSPIERYSSPPPIQPHSVDRHHDDGESSQRYSGIHAPTRKASASPTQHILATEDKAPSGSHIADPIHHPGTKPTQDRRVNSPSKSCSSEDGRRMYGRSVREDILVQCRQLDRQGDALIGQANALFKRSAILRNMATRCRGGEHEDPDYVS